MNTIKKIFALAFAIIVVCTQASAFNLLGTMRALGPGSISSEDSKNLIIGFSPLGYSHYSLSRDDIKYKFDYKSYMNFNLGYESNLEDWGYLLQLDYAKAKFDKLSVGNEEIAAAHPDDISIMGFECLFGKTFNSTRAVQFPIHWGPRLDYVKGGSFHHLTINAEIKARVKVYLSDRFGFYVGGTAYTGWGKKGKGEYKYTIHGTNAYVDAGFIINLK